MGGTRTGTVSASVIPKSSINTETRFFDSTLPHTIFNHDLFFRYSSGSAYRITNSWWQLHLNWEDARLHSMGRSRDVNICVLATWSKIRHDLIRWGSILDRHVHCQRHLNYLLRVVDIARAINSNMASGLSVAVITSHIVSNCRRYIYVCI
jgi:hypothetical protein